MAARSIFLPPEGVDSKHRHAKPGGFADGCGHSVWNVMIFKIQKDFAS